MDRLYVGTSTHQLMITGRIRIGPDQSVRMDPEMITPLPTPVPLSVTPGTPFRDPRYDLP